MYLHESIKLRELEILLLTNTYNTGRSPECTKIYIAVFITYHSLSDYVFISFGTITIQNNRAYISIQTRTFAFV